MKPTKFTDSELLEELEKDQDLGTQIELKRELVRRFKEKLDNKIKPHIFARLNESNNNVYVLEGKEEGWHDFKSKNGAIIYMQSLVEENIDFVLNPNW